MEKTSQSFMVSLFTLTLLALTCLPVWAKPLMEVSLSASKEVVETVNGKKVKKIVPAETSVAGDVLTFTVTYRNTGNEVATNAVMDNPISASMSYIDNSATGAGTEISFSIDGGKTFKKSSYLTYEVKLPNGLTEKQTARPEEYTHIRWTVSKVPPGAGGTVGYRAKIR